MGDVFTIEVEHNGGNQTFEGELKQFGFSHKFFIRVTGIELIFEPDEERNLRAIVPGDASIDKVLVQKIMHKLENGLKVRAGEPILRENKQLVPAPLSLHLPLY